MVLSVGYLKWRRLRARVTPTSAHGCVEPIERVTSSAIPHETFREGVRSFGCDGHVSAPEDFRKISVAATETTTGEPSRLVDCISSQQKRSQAEDEGRHIAERECVRPPEG